ncbi:MAG TPA: hypothetical protein VN376_02495 [Longilinea sp.]|nr:hypothetical protein [Longilinea sp.]
MRAGSIFWGSAVIIGGVILLGNNLGWFGQTNVWILIGPAFLILLGIWLLAGPYLFKNIKVETETVSIPVGDARELSIKIEHGAGKLTVDSGNDPSSLVSGTLVGGAEKTIKYEGGLTKVKFEGHSFFMFPGSSPLDWTLHVNPNLPLRLSLEGGASDNTLHLRDLKVTSLKIETGASSTNVELPSSAGFTKVKVDAGAASIRLMVPEGVAAHIKVDGALMGKAINTTRFPLAMNNVYESVDYGTASNKVEIDIDMGAGSLDIQ